MLFVLAEAGAGNKPLDCVLFQLNRSMLYVRAEAGAGNEPLDCVLFQLNRSMLFVYVQRLVLVTSLWIVSYSH